MPKTDPKSSITVLIADDHPMVREGLRSMLNAPDLTVIGEAGSGQEAVAQTNALNPDVVLMDIRMPDMDGIAALQAIKEARLPSRGIMVTTYRQTAFLLRDGRFKVRPGLGGVPAFAGLQRESRLPAGSLQVRQKSSFQTPLV